MRTVGLIVEYNPLHNGHLYHFQQSMKVSSAEAAICVMSGHFLQRGEPALASKWARAEMALAMGADVVLELPVAFSAQPAEWFAYGAVSALDARGVVDSLCFGSESGDIGWLERAAAAVCDEPEPFRRLLREELAAGRPYPAAYSRALARFMPGVQEAELAKPNNTLGLHYLIALRRLRSRIRPLTIARAKAGYNQTDISDPGIASATAIRKLLAETGRPEAVAPYMPASTLAILQREWTAGRAPIDWSRFERPLLHRLAGLSAAQLAEYAEVAEGLEHRIKRSLAALPPLAGSSVETLIERLKTKRYTRTKLQRTLLRILLNHTKPDLSREVLSRGVPYLRVLGFSERGRALLRAMKKAAKVPVIEKVTTENSPLLAMDIRATSIYALGYDAPDSRDLLRDYYDPPIRKP